MIIDNVFVTDISGTEQQMGVRLKETADSATAYIIYHTYPTGTPDTEVKIAIQTKLDAFEIPKISNNRDSLIADLME